MSENSDNAELCIAAAANVIYILAKRLRQRRRNRVVWVRRWILDRSTRGAYHNLMANLRTSDVDGFTNFMRMDPATFDELVALITPLIQRSDTHFRQSISPPERLAVTLRYLATGKHRLWAQEFINY